MRFEGKVAIVTGSGRGIGRAVALQLAREGGKVLVNDVDEDVAGSTAAEIKTAGGEAVVCVTSVTDRRGVARMVSETVAAFGALDILINNAGVTRLATALKMTEEEWDQVIDINLKGVFNCIQAVGPVFVESFKRNPEARCSGKIVNITSVAGLRGTIGQVNYGAAKAGVIGITMSMAREWARYKVTSNAVALGTVETRLTNTLRTDPRFREKYLDDIPLHRFASPEEITPSILFLASSDSDYITGHVMNVSGGFHVGF